MLPRLRIVGSDGVNGVHEAALRILERTGVVVDLEGALSLLADAGCMVDWGSNVVRFPPDLVMRQAALVPKSLVLGSRNPGNDIRLGEGYPRPRTRPGGGM